MPNPNISQIVSTTLANYKKEITDNIENSCPLFVKLKDKGNIIKESGGYSFQEKLFYSQNSTTQWQGEYDTFNTTPQDIISSAEFAQKILTGTVSMTDLEMKQNAGKERIVSLMESKMKNLMSSMKNNIATSIFSDGTGSGGDELGGLQLLIADDPSTGTVGGIDRTTYPFWRNQIYDFSVATVTPSASTIQDAMNTLYLRCQAQAGAFPDLIVADEVYYSYFERSLQQNQRFVNVVEGKLGFKGLAYKDAVVVYDQSCPAQHMYFINTNHVFFKHLGDLYDVGQATRPVNQSVYVTPVITTGNLTIDNARVHGVMHA